MEKPSLGQKIRYAFDNTLSRGTIALIAWLALLSTLTITGLSLVVWGFGILPDEVAEKKGFVDVLWMALMRSMDAGTVGGDEGGWGFLLMMLVITFCGIFIFSTLIGLLTSGIEAQLDELRKGRSPVIEKNHTVILGWTPQVFAILHELSIANQSQKDSCVVILGNEDKVTMEDEVRERLENPGRMRVICRSGSPIDLNDLDRVSVQTSKSIIIPSPVSEDPDSEVIKTLLALTNSPRRRKEKYHIVAEIRDPKNMEAARLVGRDEAELILVGDLISRITVQTCRQSGLSVVYTELLDFDGCEIYFKEEPGLVGKSFGESLFEFEESSVIGLRKKDGRVLVNPSMEMKVESGDEIIVIAEDDSMIALSKKPKPGIREELLQNAPPPFAHGERTLILGWNWRVPTLIRELEQYVAEGSTVHLVNSKDHEDIDAAIAEQVSPRKLQLSQEQGDITSRKLLDALNVTSYNHVLILCEDGLEPQRADARVLITLLHLRDISEKSGKPVSIVSEMLDGRNRDLARVTRADDFIVSEKLISLMLSQISENKELNAVFTDLFDPEGSEIYLKPATHYVEAGKKVNFYTLCEAARRRGEVAFGYRLAALANDEARGYGVVVNPAKSKELEFGPSDKVIVLAES